MVTAWRNCALWDVTDGEIDRLTAALLERCTTGKGASGANKVELLTAVAAARGACRLRFLTGAATVVYGAPLQVHLRDPVH